MDINRLRYFCVIAQTGSIRKSAEMLKLSPAALSKAVRLLEEETGLKLTSPNGRSIEITDQGKKLAKKGGELIREIELLKNDIELDRVTSDEVKIATFEVFSTYFLKSLEHVGTSQTAVTLYDLVPGDLEKAIVDRHADYGLTYLPIPTRELDHVKITSIEMGVFTSKSAFPGVPQPELPFVVPVMPITGSPSRIRGLDGWPDDTYPRKIQYQVTLLESALELCRQGRAAGYFPLFVVEAHNAQVKERYQLVRRPSIYKGRVCKTDVFLVKRKTDLEDSRFRSLAKAVRLTCNPN